MNRIVLMFFLSLVFTQHTIETKEFVFFKNNNIETIDFSDYLFDDSRYILSLNSIKSFKSDDIKKTILSNCDLKITLSNYSNTKEDKKVLFSKQDGISASLCDSVLTIENSLIIEKDKPLIKISSNTLNAKGFECEFVFWITGKFDVQVNSTSDKKNHGYLREWYDNGSLFIEYKYDNGKKNGIQKRWYENGQQEILYYYDQGKLNGTQLKWYSDGTLKSKFNYLYDNQHGKSEEWFTDGTLKYIKVFDNGTLVNIQDSSTITN